MRQSKRFIALFLVVISLVVLLPFSAYASFSYKTLNYGRWYDLNKSSSNVTIYRLKVSEDSLITIEWKGFQTGEIYGAIYRDKECFDEMECFLDDYSGKTGIVRFVLYSGTYYIGMMEKGSGKNTTKVKVTKQSVRSINKGKNNISQKRAILLKQKKVIELAFTKNDNKPRWYKIKPTSSRVSFYISDSFPFRIYDENLNEVEGSYGGYSGFSSFDSSDVNKGYSRFTPGFRFKQKTYYLVIDPRDNDISETGMYVKFYWKTNRLF